LVVVMSGAFSSACACFVRHPDGLRDLHAGDAGRELA
jgi:hypothetical protein